MCKGGTWEVRTMCQSWDRRQERAGYGVNGYESASQVSRPKEDGRTVNVSERAADTSTGSIC